MPQASDINLDFDRAGRTGLAEAVFCEGKSDAQLAQLTQSLLAASKPMLYTRLAPSQHERLPQACQAALDYDPISRTAFLIPQPSAAPSQPQANTKSALASSAQPAAATAISSAAVIPEGAPAASAQNKPQPAMAQPSQPSSMAVVSGGSSDLPVAREAIRTLNFYGHHPLEAHDLGVAGLWRLTERLDELRQRRIIICVAGMEAALPTVLAGLVPAALIAVPTSIGYGTANGGETALRALLTSCAPGLSVVNIDNGYGAACCALRIQNTLATQ